MKDQGMKDQRTKDQRKKDLQRVKITTLLLGALAVLVFGLYRVHKRHEVIRIGYELNELRTELRALNEDNRRLSLEESVLTNPGRIEKLAKALGMVRPSPDQFRIIEGDVSVVSLND